MADPGEPEIIEDIESSAMETALEITDLVTLAPESSHCRSGTSWKYFPWVSEDLPDGEQLNWASFRVVLNYCFVVESDGSRYITSASGQVTGNDGNGLDYQGHTLSPSATHDTGCAQVGAYGHFYDSATGTVDTWTPYGYVQRCV